MKNMPRCLAAACAMLVLAGACRAQAVVPTAPPAAAAVSAPAPGPTSTGAPAAERVDYVLGAGDTIRISVFQSPDLALETRISESGVITYPLLGVVKLGGLSISAAEKKLADGLRAGNFLKQPQVSILVLQVRGNQVSVLGQVNRPGRFPLEVSNTRLSDVLAQAGGVAANGNDIVTVVGTRDGKPFRRQIDLPAVFAGADQRDDIVMQNGDVVYVDRMALVYIYGEVQRPGSMRLERDMSLMQALANGGGLTLRGTQRGVRVHRRGPDGRVEVITPALDDKLKDADVVYVRESLF
jgi:polysaccharide export outer membrane protein